MSREGQLNGKLPPWTTDVQTQWDPLRSLEASREQQERGAIGVCGRGLASLIGLELPLGVASSRGLEQAWSRGERCRSSEETAARRVLHLRVNSGGTRPGGARL